MKVTPINMPDGTHSWCIIDSNDEVIAPVLQYLQYLYHLQRSPNTIRAYAYHLKHFWEYLRADELEWSTIKLEQLAGFITWLRAPCQKVVVIHSTLSKRAESSINAALAAVTAFYKFQEQVGNIKNLNLYGTSMAINPSYKPFLNHLNTTRLAKTHVLKIKVPARLPRTLDHTQVLQLLQACYYKRDQFLLCTLYETGMRIGQLLGLRHQDIHSWDNEIHLVPRNNNSNQARSKAHHTQVLPVTSSLMKVYSNYVLSELEHIDSDYVFVCLKGKKRGQPLRYTAIQDLFVRFSKSIHRKVTPHMLRHTHATELLRQGWDMALIQKRLGHLNIQTTINIYTHLSSADLKKALATYPIRSLADAC